MHHRSKGTSPAEKMARLTSSWTAEDGRNTTVIECASCHCFGFGRLAYAEVEALLCEGSISRFCPRCGETTKWRQIDIHSEAGKPKGSGVDFPEALPSHI